MNSFAALEEIRRILLENDDFVIASHVNPDSDAIGSCLALGLSLKKLGKHVNVLLDPFNKKNLIIPGQELIWTDTSIPPASSVFIILDCANIERIGDPFSLIKSAPVTVCIDHHMSHAPFTRHLYLDPKASSTCELIYRIVSPVVDLDAGIASAIYAGLLTDTGGFRFNSTSVETMRIASELIALNIPFTDIYNELMRRHSIPETMVMRTALNNLKLLNNGRTAFSLISSEEMNKINACTTDTDGVSEYLLNIIGVEVSVFLYEKKKNEVKASIRSSFLNVSEIAKAFGGGGHILAAGCTIYAPLTEAYNDLTAAIRSAMGTV